MAGEHEDHGEFNLEDFAGIDTQGGDPGDEDAGDETEDEGDAAATDTGAAPSADAGKSGDDKADAGDRAVPLEALHEARHQNRELREQLQRLQQFVTPLKEQMEQLRAQQQKPAEPEEEEVDWNDDPRGYIDQKFSKIMQALEQTGSKTEQIEQATTQQQQLQGLTQAIAQDHENFSREHPDVSEAIVHARGVRMQELQDMGLSEVQARQTVNNEELQLAAIALQNGKSPAQVAYQRAQRWGYQPKAPQGGEGDQGKAAGDTEVDEEAKEDAQSMGGSGGPSVQDLLEAEEDEFDQFWKELGYGEQMK